MKILFDMPIVDMQLIKELKKDKHTITFDKKSDDVDMIVDSTNMYFKDYPSFSMSYKHWVDKSTDLSYIINLLEETLHELQCYSF